MKFLNKNAYILVSLHLCHVNWSVCIRVMLLHGVMSVTTWCHVWCHVCQYLVSCMSLPGVMYVTTRCHVWGHLCLCRCHVWGTAGVMYVTTWCHVCCHVCDCRCNVCHYLVLCHGCHDTAMSIVTWCNDCVIFHIKLCWHTMSCLSHVSAQYLSVNGVTYSVMFDIT